jgi:hypothetical protein
VAEVRGPDVVAAWGAGNGALLAILIGYGEGPIPIALYAGSVALLELVALVTWWVMRRHPAWAHRTPGPQRAVPAVLAALVAAAVGAGLVWSWWLALPGLYPLGALAGRFASAMAGPDDARQGAAR